MGAADQGAQSIGLRRRLGVLEHAHALSTDHSADISGNTQRPTIPTKDDHNVEETSGHSHSSLTDYETDSSESEDLHGAQTPVPESQSNPEAASSASLPPNPPPYKAEPRSRSWYEFDLAFFVALVAPVGNWLTGGEHVKNVLVVMLILFYLHQVVEVPWSLYQKSRPRRRSSSSIPSSSNSKEFRYHSKATSELRFFEFFFLLLATASPFLGAYTLNYLSLTLTNTDILSSWFNTSLFVLATGVRPWSHLVKRISQRITDLHDIIHYPTPESSSETTEVMRSELEEMKIQVRTLQEALVNLNSKVIKDTDEMYDYVDDAVEMVEKAAKKHERKCEKQEGKVKELEISLDSLKETTRPRPSSLSLPDHPPNWTSTSSLHLPSQLTSTLPYISSVLPPWLPLPSILLPSSGSGSPTSPPQYEPKHSPCATVTRYSVLSLSSPDGLATIPEEGHQSAQTRPTSPSVSAFAPAPSSSSGSSSVSRLRGGHSYDSPNHNASNSNNKKPSGTRSRSRSRSPSPSSSRNRVRKAGTQLPPEYAKLGLFQRLLVRILYIVMFPLREVMRMVWGRKGKKTGYATADGYVF